MCVLIVSLAIAHWIAAARAECPLVTLEADFKESAVVFIGRAVAQSVGTMPGEPDVRATETTFEVEGVWKGKAEPTMRVWTCGGIVGDQAVVCSVGFTFLIGTKYVVFAEGQPLRTSACGHTAPEGRTGDALQWLSQKPLTRPPSPKRR
jgi:hypothetical protein